MATYLRQLSICCENSCVLLPPVLLSVRIGIFKVSLLRFFPASSNYKVGMKYNGLLIFILSIVSWLVVLPGAQSGWDYKGVIMPMV